MKSREIELVDLFEVEELQKLQDVFSEAHRVSSIITTPEGEPITKPSNFTNFCFNLVRSSPIGCANCMKSDTAIGQQSLGGPIIQPCASAGLWDAGASISVGGQHIASWLIGQVRNEDLNQERVLKYADEIGVDKKEFLDAFMEVPYMSYDQFTKVAEMLYYFANQISDKAYAKSELEKAMIEKDKFLSIVAHDLRSPFNSILGYTEIMADDIDNMSLPEIKAMANLLKKSSRNLFVLLENLLQWSLIKRGKSAFNPQWFKFNELFEETIELLNEIITRKDIEILSSFPEILSVYGDKGMLESVLRNLISNSIKFSSKGGKIQVGVKKGENESLLIWVRDSGIGMNENIVSSLFQLSNQTNRTGTDGERSNGLGLIICKEFVEKHEGKIWVESKEGKGSIFYISIPQNNT